MKLIEQIEEILIGERGGMHVNDIASQLIQTYSFKKEDAVKLPSRVSSVLASAVKKKGTRFTKPKNKQGKFKKGMYRLKRSSTPKVVFAVAPKVNTQYTGCAGEHAVLSELLFWGFNASMMTVDDGIDIVASRNNDYFHIQVKTANASTNDSYGFSIDTKKHIEKYNASTFYVLVLRRRINDKQHSNDYVILPSYEIQSMIAKGVIRSSQSISMKVTVVKERFFLNGEDVTHIANNFDIIR